MASGPKTSLLTMLSGGISRSKKQSYSGFVKNKKVRRRTSLARPVPRWRDYTIGARWRQPGELDPVFRDSEAAKK